MKKFYLQRKRDVAGVSVTGRVMEGVILSDGRVCSTWLSATLSMTVHNDIEAARYIHCYNENSVFVFDNKDIYFKTYMMSCLKNEISLTKIGHVADIAVFTNGKCVLNWLLYPYQIEFFDSFDALKTVHQSNNYTVIEEKLVNTI